MISLTTRQRDLLQLLLAADAPRGSSELADEMHLTSRQVNYSLKGLETWLVQYGVNLKMTPGVGVELNCSPEQHLAINRQLESESSLQLILTPEQRQQLLALILLVADEPLILFQLQQLTQVSRTTILKDLDIIATWLQLHDLQLERRPNYGVIVSGQERARRNALSAWLYGETIFGQPLTKMTYTDGPVFSLSSDADLLPIVGQVSAVIRQLNIQQTVGQVAYAEAQLGGRFTDDAVLYLALALAIQAARIDHGHTITVDSATLTWLESSSAWHVATQIARRLGWRKSSEWPREEIAGVAMLLLASPRNERWPGDLEVDGSFAELVDALMLRISEAYDLPILKEDRTLRDGIVIHIVPACLRHRFKVWMPSPSPTTALADKYDFEHGLARLLSTTIKRYTDVTLENGDLNDLKLLLRAAFIRARPSGVHDVMVVCPSGMATAQLLIARLKTRFPRLGELTVVSLRELSQSKVASAKLIITTVPLPRDINSSAKVIQVHPMLLPEDIEAITQWLA